MPINEITTDPQGPTMTISAEYPVPVRQLWDTYLDPRRIERFWGPEGWPATFTRHDGFPGGRSAYEMRGPDGERSGGYWEFTDVEAPSSFTVVDGFAREDGSPNTEMPSIRMEFRFAPTQAGSRLDMVTTFGSAEQLQELIGMGMEDGTRSAMSQIDGVLADVSSFEDRAPAQTQILSDTQVRVSRVVRGPVDDVWRAHQDPELMRRWLLGPDGWTMPVCEVPSEVGGTYRYEWEPEPGGDAAQTGERFGFTGELVESHAPYRSVTTEQMIGMEGPGTVNELTLTPLEGGTLVSTVITYPSVELRDLIIGTGMVDGMERSYQRLESEVLST